jgi:hypothetical protein
VKADELLAKVEELLFEENCDSVKMNPRDYTEHFMLNIGSRHYEPETKIPMLKIGVVGYLHGPSGQPPKTISVDKLIESGNIQGIKTYKI